MDGHVPGIRLSDIIITRRVREELGDIDSLAISIKELGLLQPILVTADKHLVSGYRRIKAVESLGWEAIPVYVGKVDDLVDRLRAERDENTCRKDLTTSELMELGRQIEAEYALEATRNMQIGAAVGRAHRYGTDTPVTPTYDPMAGPRANGQSLRTTIDRRELAAKAIKMSTSQYSRVKQIHTAAHNPQLPDSERERAVAAMALIDRISQGEEILVSPDRSAKMKIGTVYDRWRKDLSLTSEETPIRKSPPVRTSINSALNTLNGLIIGLASVQQIPDDITREELEHWMDVSSKAGTTLDRFRKKLRRARERKTP